MKKKGLKESIIDPFIGAFIAIIVVFAILAVVIFSVESTVNSLIKNNTTKFVNESCISGEIGADRYLDYTDSISRFGSYDIELAVDRKRSYPKANDDGSIIYGETRKSEDRYTTEEIMEYMYPLTEADRDYALAVDDSITITVVRQHSVSSGIFRSIFRRSNSDTIITQYTNTVGYTTDKH